MPSLTGTIGVAKRCVAIKHGTKYTATLWEIHPVWKIAPAS
jgi:hypothetical protein